MKKIIQLSLFLFSVSRLFAQTTIVSYGSAWKYLDNGTNQGTAWRAVSFNDAGWASGNAQLGYGDGDEATVVSYGPNANQKYITTYFRKTITVTNASAFTGFTLNIKRDDGAVVYINGTERFRTNMPTGTITYTTRASTDAADDGNTVQTTALAAGVLVNGTNVIAVEIHQRNRTSSDISFDLQLTGNGDVTPPAVTDLTPADNSTDIAVNSNLVLTFNETVQKGAGNILIKEGAVITQTIDVTSAAVTVVGNIVTIDPADFGNGAAVNIEIAAGALKDISNNNYAGIADAATWNFDVLFTDITPPTVINYSPSDDAANVSAGSNLILTFSEAVQKGTGNIVIKEGGVITQTIDVNSSAVTVVGNLVTIDPADFTYSAAVNIEITAGAITDLAGNNYAGITGATTWNFTIVNPDLTPPTVTNYSPADDATDVSANTSLVLTFNEAVQKGTGNILVKESGVIVQTIDVTSASVTVSGNIVTIDPADFTNSAAVNIEISAGAITDLANNNYAGIADAITWNFTIVDPDLTPPTVTNYSPADDATDVSAGTNLVLTFNEAVQKGTGNILVKESGFIIQTIDVTSASVTVTGNVVTIDPANFGNGAAVHIEITGGAFADLANNNYAGIADTNTWNFSVLFTDIIPPAVTNYSPADDATDVSASTNLILTFNEAVQKGTGNILVKESGVIVQTIDVTSASVIVSGNIVTIDPANFGNGAAVHIEIAAGAFTDLSSNNYAGIADAITWNFSVLFTDIIPPTVTNYSPPDNATSVSAGSNLVLTFSETVQKGTGNIIVKESGVITQTIDVNSASVTVAGNVVTIDPADFGNGASVNIEITAGAITDLANNNYEGIAGAATWNFSILLIDIIPPTVTNYSPPDNATNVLISSNLVLTFSETVQKGTGNILVKESGVITQTIDVTSASVTVTGNIVTINPSDFGYTAAVNIEIAAGAFKDPANNDYAGITNATTWNFTTEDLVTGPQTFIAYGASWKYLDNGTNQGTAWRGASFDDASWASGNAQLGYGDGDETTIVSYGPNASAKYITTYFRKTITISNPLAFSSFTGNVKRDDGVVIYVNGTEVYRSNMPTGTVTYTTLASSAASDDGNTAQVFTISSSAFASGNNVITVEMHQNSGTSSDLSFDLQLTSNVAGAASLTRGPYLNMGNQAEVTLRWRTDVATNSKVELGTTFGTYPVVVNDAASTTEHEVRVTGLTADTKYFYRFGSSTQVLQAGTDNYLTTQPPGNTTRKLRFAAFGDCGRNDNGFQSGSLSSYLSFAGANPAEALLLLGDNAYNNGTDAEYQSNYFNVYSANILKNHQLFPAPGNHEYANSATLQDNHNIPYYSIFTNPANAQCGGVVSGTEAYYSWDWGNVHFLSLDSYGEENGGTTRLYDTLGAQAVWVKQDLAANTKPWIVAYWHHPPYTMGSHNSDTESELINMRQNFIRILERMGVDLILCGHSHDYERSYLLKGHFGNEASFNVGTHALSSSSAKYDGTANSCTYTTVSGQNHGTVYVVSGSAGADGGVQAGYPHNAMPWSVDDGGMLYFEVEDNRLDAKFIRRTGVISDQFTIMKNVNKTTNLFIPSGTPTQLTASWVGNYSWSTGATTRSITVSPVSNTTYTVSDNLSCVSDVFNITISGGITRASNSEETIGTAQLEIQPTLVRKGQMVKLHSSDMNPVRVILTDLSGRRIQTYNFNGLLNIETGNLQPGIYIIKAISNRKTITQKFVVME